MTRLLVLAIVVQLAALAQMPCERLKSVPLANAAVTSTEAIPEGPYLAPRPGTVAPALPPHCRVALTMTPTSDSDIKAEVWMPVAATWNGKFMAVGGGAFVGS